MNQLVSNAYCQLILGFLNSRRLIALYEGSFVFNALVTAAPTVLSAKIEQPDFGLSCVRKLLNL